MKKRLLLLLLALLGVPILLFGIYLIVIFVDAFVDELEADAAPVTFASYNVHESSTIDPATILSSINQGDQNVFNFELGFPPDDSPFVTSVEWRQEDFMNLAASIFHVAWNEFISDWNLYRMRYWTRCDDLSGFSWGELHFYLETSDHKEYSLRGIDMQPEYGYVTWGGDTYRHRPYFRWKVINLKEVTVTAEEALHRAEASGGMEFRRSIENKCIIDVVLWPDVSGRYDWRVSYTGDSAYTTNEPEFWIPTK
ncbi:MAG TPA: hypothetical protein PKC99_12565 [Anaerolineales bacterium]|mgnify:CR=1 FL=1|jgi:hypothetical protein|nr:hypothetical protein [Anaerolineae bacterium AMX1]NOG75690.1 hypothetical protein [Chloroflexota bacterium]WKZ55119.1 MAG: hypothetical protein QY324_03650 [Anaerolineales bacterium]GIK10826.1 MAG: hypothetical protein BroJett001_28920 [Chloroflexota bacterium]HMM99837.1 hypothetical protein [Anaerolineales bacterium]